MTDTTNAQADLDVTMLTRRGRIEHSRTQPRPRVVGRAVLTDSAALATWKATIVAAIVDAGWTSPPADAPLELVVEPAMPTAKAKREACPRSVVLISTI